MTIEEVEQQHLILKVYAGSIVYGTNTKDSDTDIRGIFIPPKEYFFGLKNVEQVIQDHPLDITYFAIKKFFNLALNANPNILELLFTRENYYIWKDVPIHNKKYGQLLIKNRHLFLSKKVRHSLMGYAFAQANRMNKLNKNVGQNEKRSTSVKKWGYDTKNAMHLIRLCKMALEVLTEGELFVFRQDAQELLNIKNGKYSYDELMDMFKNYDRLVEEAYVRTSLPHTPNYEKINNLLMSIVENYFYEKQHTNYHDVDKYYKEEEEN